MERFKPSTGGTVGIFAPSSPFSSDRFEAGLKILQGLGLETKVHAQAHERTGFLAGPDEARAQALHELLEDDEVTAVFAARGGYGLHRIVQRVDPAAIRAAAKPIVGFSDVTALHAAVQNAGLMSIHGPVVTQLGDLSGDDHEILRRVLAGDWSQQPYAAKGPALRGGVARGPLVGGCLSVLIHLVGTEHLFVPDGAVLLLEDVGEAPYRIDRMLTHLRLAKILDRVAGVALGDFVGCTSPRPGEQSVEVVLRDRLEDLGVPVLMGLPFGHGRTNLAVPLGAEATLDADAGHLSVHD